MIRAIMQEKDYETLKKIVLEQVGFLDGEQIRALSYYPEISTLMCLVRCGAMRFLIQLADVNRIIDIITREGTDYVRDVSFDSRVMHGLRMSLSSREINAA